MLAKVCAGLAAGAVVLALTGCNDDPDVAGMDPTPTPTAEPTDGPSLSPDLNFEDADSDGDGAEAQGDNESEFATDQECLTDTWRLDNDSWIVATGASFSDDGAVLSSVTGTVIMDLRSDGSYSSVYQDWTMNLTTPEGSGGGTITRDGVDSGTWSVSGGDVEIVEVEGNSTIRSVFEIDGQTFEMDMLEGEANAVETFGYVCAADTLTSITSEGTFAFVRE